MNFGVEGETDDEAVIEAREKQKRNLLATLLLSQGVPMLLGGDEIGRTQGGNNNGYAQDNEISWFDWSLDRRDRQLLAFTRSLIRLLKAHPVLRRRKFFQGRQIRGSRVKDLTWFAPDGTETTDEQWQAPGVRTLAVQFAGDAIDDRGPRGEKIVDDTLLVILNADERPVAFTLPNHAAARRWEVVFDTVHASFTAAHGEHDGGADVPRRRALGGLPAPAAAGPTCRRGMSTADARPETRIVDAYRKRRTIARPRSARPCWRRWASGPMRCRRTPAASWSCGRERACRSRARSSRGRHASSAGSTRLPPDVPFGYHRLDARRRKRRPAHRGPGPCHLPAGLREWGWAVQLPTTRSRRSWGIGDLGDLRELAAWSRRVGAGFLTVSPLGAPQPGPDPEPSPYFPSTRRFGSPLALRAEELPGAIDLDELAEAARALNGDASSTAAGRSR